MGVMIVAVVAVLAIAFMVQFFVAICRESSKIKLCQFIRIDTDALPENVEPYTKVGPVLVDSVAAQCRVAFNSGESDPRIIPIGRSPIQKRRMG